DGWGFDYWAGIRAEFAAQGEGNAAWKEDTCGNFKGVDVCFQVRFFGRVSGGAQGRLKAGRWGILTIEATINGELSNNTKFCLTGCSLNGCTGHTIEWGK